MRLRRGVGVGDGQRARGSHRVLRKGYSEEGRKRTGAGRGERVSGREIRARGFGEKRRVCLR